MSARTVLSKVISHYYDTSTHRSLWARYQVGPCHCFPTTETCKISSIIPDAQSNFFSPHNLNKPSYPFLEASRCHIPGIYIAPSTPAAFLPSRFSKVFLILKFSSPNFFLQFIYSFTTL